MGDPLFGVWPRMRDDDGSPSIALGLIMLNLETGAEAIVHQVGELVHELEVVDVGIYELSIAPDAPMHDDQVYVIAQPYDSVARAVIVEIDLSLKLIRLQSFAATGQRASVSRCALAMYLDPWTPTPETSHATNTELQLAPVGAATSRMGGDRRSHRPSGQTIWRDIRDVFARGARTATRRAEPSDRGK